MIKSSPVYGSPVRMSHSASKFSPYQSSQSDSTDKQAASASALLAADYIVTELIFKDRNNLTLDDMAAIMTKKEEVDVNSRALKFIYELVGRNPNRFRANEFGEYQGEVWGKFDGQYIYIIKSVFDRELLVGGFNSTAFLSWAQRRGYLLFDSGRKTKKARIVGNSVHCVCILNADRVEEREQREQDREQPQKPRKPVLTDDFPF